MNPLQLLGIQVFKEIIIPLALREKEDKPKGKKPKKSVKIADKEYEPSPLKLAVTSLAAGCLLMAVQAGYISQDVADCGQKAVNEQVERHAK